MRKISVAPVLFTLLFFAGCSKKTAPAKTAAEPPKPKATSYVADVQPLIMMKCVPCHVPSKGGFKTNFENYTAAQKYAAEMVSRIQRNPGEKGFMPFKNPKLTEAEINVFKKWVSDGAPEN